MSEQPDDELGYPYEEVFRAAFPALHARQNEWLGALDSLTSPDRKTHELVRLACVVAIRNEPGIERHAALAREVGATWPEVAGTILLTQPAFGIQPAVHALPVAKRAFDAAQPPPELH